MKFIYFYSNEKIIDYIPFLIEVFSPTINIVKYQSNDKSLTIYFDYINGEIDELVESLVSDMFVSFTIYESIVYSDLKKAEEQFILFKEIIKTNQVNAIYLNQKTLLSQVINNKNDLIKEFILSDYYNDLEMKKTIITFLENDQNVSNASKALYLHRNTLNQRLDKFQNKTSFDIKKFIDGYLIYRLLKK